ncbi:MAG: hypothetical protein AVDCRST_MAG89-1328, partial [uncultured Gemmatimonadetes bacterium]
GPGNRTQRQAARPDLERPSPGAASAGRPPAQHPRPVARDGGGPPRGGAGVPHSRGRGAGGGARPLRRVPGAAGPAGRRGAGRDGAVDGGGAGGGMEAADDAGRDPRADPPLHQHRAPALRRRGIQRRPDDGVQRRARGAVRADGGARLHLARAPSPPRPLGGVPRGGRGHPLGGPGGDHQLPLAPGAQGGRERERGLGDPDGECRGGRDGAAGDPHRRGDAGVRGPGVRQPPARHVRRRQRGPGAAARGPGRRPRGRGRAGPARARDAHPRRPRAPGRGH